ncbi:MAG: hypothetical protein KME26_18440 [Oscillatoria princeps RMCB-10]|jgi:hypothetical protein|nr:hypothetical protein [Oscillatoria princeps RMCB-10]
MKIPTLLPCCFCGYALAANLATGHYGQFDWLWAWRLAQPAALTAARAWRRAQPAVKALAEFPVGERAFGCAGSRAPARAYTGFSPEKWAKFKAGGKGQTLQHVVETLGGAFCQAADGSLRFLPDWSADKRLDVRLDRLERVEDARLY